MRYQSPLFRLFGSSTFTLRLVLLLFFVLFLLCMYYLTSLLYTKKLALFTTFLLCFGSKYVLVVQTRAIGAYAETFSFAAFISLASSWLVLSYHKINGEKRTMPRRIFVYGTLGLVAGIAVWVDLLILPFLATAMLLLLLFCRRELRSWAGGALLLGILIGAFPLIYYNLTEPLNNSLITLLNIHQQGSDSHIPFLQQVVGTLMIAIPEATGFSSLCPAEALPYFGKTNISCLILPGSWGLGYLILWVLAAFLAIYAIWRIRSHPSPDALIDQQAAKRECCRLLLLVAAGGTILLYALSPAAALTPGPSSRYLIGLLVATPVVLWPLWNGLSVSLQEMPDTISQMRHRWQTRISQLIRFCVLMAIFIVFTILGIISTFNDIPPVQRFSRQQDQLIQTLLSLGATRIYSEYWTCNRLIFQSREQIICAVLDENLAPGFDRYTPYRRIVRMAAHPAFVFPQGSAQAAKIAKSKQFGDRQRIVLDGYVIFVPKQYISGKQDSHTS